MEVEAVAESAELEEHEEEVHLVININNLSNNFPKTLTQTNDTFDHERLFFRLKNISEIEKRGRGSAKPSTCL